jgi:hypothetical protein
MMHRIFCESYYNYLDQYTSPESKKEYRYQVVKPLELIVNLEKYKQEEALQSDIYKQVKDLLHYMSACIEDYPRFKAFLWTVESRNIMPEYFGVVSLEDLTEQSKIINMFLKLVYWEKVVA